jgi:hypothetical protein
MKIAITIIAFCLFIGFPAVSDAIFLGPYSGNVLDSQSGEPIAGASVFFYWTQRIPNVGGGNSETIECKLIYTDSKGRYDIPKNNYNIGLMAFFESTKIIIYQPGYQAYTQDIEKDNPYWKPDPSFKEIENMVKLKRIPPNFSHRNHYSSIDSALWGLREIDELGMAYTSENDDEVLQKYLKANQLTIDSFRGKINKILQKDSKIVPMKEDFLRRVRWEERRGSSEERN